MCWRRFCVKVSMMYLIKSRPMISEAAIQDAVGAGAVAGIDMTHVGAVAAVPVAAATRADVVPPPSFLSVFVVFLVSSRGPASNNYTWHTPSLAMR
jgi:hypothetical protein